MSLVKNGLNARNPIFKTNGYFQSIVIHITRRCWDLVNLQGAQSSRSGGFQGFQVNNLEATFKSSEDDVIAERCEFDKMTWLPKLMRCNWGIEIIKIPQGQGTNRINDCDQMGMEDIASQGSYGSEGIRSLKRELRRNNTSKHQI